MTIRAMVVAAAVMSIAAGAPQAGDPLATVLNRAAAYLEQLEQSCSTIIADERYEQKWLHGGISPRTRRPAGEERQLVSELLFVWIPADREWLAVRDVIRIDDRVVPDNERPLKTLLRSPLLISNTRLHDLLAENARYNLGPIARNFNDPTLGLLPLDGHLQERFALSIASRGRSDGMASVTIRFEERQRPTLVQTVRRDSEGRLADSDDLFLTGSVSIDEASGAILRTTVEVNDRLFGTRGRLVTVFARQPRFGLWLPATMVEEYSSESTPGQRITAKARYSNYRRFETSGRLVLPK